MNDLQRNFIIGLATILALLGLAYLMFRFGEFENVMRPKYAVVVEMNRAAGLAPGSPVELNGVRVGTVTDVELQQSPTHPVRVLAMIDESTQVPGDVKPEVVQQIIGGGATLLLVSAMRQDITPLPTDGTAVVRGIVRPLTEQITAELDERMAPIMAALEDFNDLVDIYSEVGSNLNVLLEPMNEELGTGPGGLVTMVERLNEALANANDAMQLASEWLGDEQIRADARLALRNANELLDQAELTLHEWETLAGSLEQQAGELQADISTELAALRSSVVPVADEMALAVEELQLVLRQANEGEGTIGLLLRNPDLYLSMTDAIQRLEQTLINIDLLIDKLRAEGVRVGL